MLGYRQYVPTRFSSCGPHQSGSTGQVLEPPRLRTRGSQQVNKRDRASGSSWELCRALGCQEGFLIRPAELIRKPKGMHWRTFGQKIEQLKRVDARALEDAAAMLASIERGVKIAEVALSHC